MHSWNMGYDTETNYNYLYFGQLNPYRLRFNFLAQGLAFPKLDSNCNACELGFGNGLSVVIHAAASQVNWYGNDFNPSQTSFAKKFADQGSIKVNLSDDAFDQFLKRDDLPMFDYICLHGIYSWISPENQDVIVEFVKNKLKVGGILYISYNVKPDFGAIEPFRFLIYSYIQNFGDPSKTSPENVPAVIDFIKKLIDTDPAFTKKAPWVLKSFETHITNQNHTYVSHEFNNDHWLLQNFDMVANKFEQAKLTYVCQANLANNISEYCLNPKQQAELAKYAGSPLEQQVKDFITSNSFRTDVYVKGLVKLSQNQQRKELDESYFIYTHDNNSKEFSIVIGGEKKQVDLEKINPLLSILKDNKPHSFKELRERLSYDAKPSSKEQVYSYNELFDALVYAYSFGMIKAAVPPQDITPEVIGRCQKLNQYILHGNHSVSIMSLTSPVSGGGIIIDDIDKILINLATRLDNVDQDLIANAVANILLSSKSASEGIMINNKRVTDPKEINDYIQRYAKSFLEHKLPLYKNMLIV